MRTGTENCTTTSDANHYWPLLSAVRTSRPDDTQDMKTFQRCVTRLDHLQMQHLIVEQSSCHGISVNLAVDLQLSIAVHTHYLAMPFSNIGNHCIPNIVFLHCFITVSCNKSNITNAIRSCTQVCRGWKNRLWTPHFIEDLKKLPTSTFIYWSLMVTDYESAITDCIWALQWCSNGMF